MRVGLVTMPFGAVDRPSIALGLLKASLAGHGIDVDVAYLNLAFARRLGAEGYARISAIWQRAMAGDWVFAGSLYDGEAPRADAYVSRVLRAEWQLDEESVEAVLEARELAPTFLSDVLEDPLWATCDVVGFTCSYSQTVPSLALARLMKERHPDLYTVFGGSTWQDAMGRTLFASFPFVDAACIGEGDRAFPDLVQALAENRIEAVGEIPGMLVRGPQTEAAERPYRLVDDLDDLPIPDYSDYMTALSHHGFAPDDGVVIPMETSRGCWWGARGPCRFCGLLGAHRQYRTKSSRRILDELRVLSAQPGCRIVEIVDAVAAPALLHSVLPRLAEDPLPLPLDVDVRPGIDRRTIELLAAADSIILTGIETLSDRLLDLMDKGVGTLECVHLLKWSRAHGVRVRWNLLHGFPGETAADYGEILSVFEAIPHLDPPFAVAVVGLERSSPYWENPESFGFTNVRPAREYVYLYPFDERTLSDIAYFFEHDFAPGYEPQDGFYRVRHRVWDWEESTSVCDLRISGGGDIVVDSRRPEDAKTHHLDELERTLYLACDDIRSRTELEEDVCRAGIEGEGLTERIDEALGWFVERGLMLQRDDRYLSLALPECAPPPAAPATAASETERVQLQGV